jgi:pimeloyl-ACP methyl ester carboxylesterase
MKLWQKILLGVAAVIFLLSVIFVVWGETPARPMPEAMLALQSDEQVEVTAGDWLIFTPQNQAASTGLIFYPGGRVDYRAYAPLAHALAQQGILVIIPRMPLNLAVFGAEKAAEVLQTYPTIKYWYIGGHSLGGSMAAHFLNQHRDQFTGLIFLASYPATSDDLSDYSGKVLSISASYDGLATPDKIAASRSLLPQDAKFFEIHGGNHAQFGWYGAQSGDLTAAISRTDQQEQTIQQILIFLQE